MAPHSSVLAWRIPGTEEHGGLQSMGVAKTVGHDLMAAELHAYCLLIAWFVSAQLFEYCLLRSLFGRHLPGTSPN